MPCVYWTHPRKIMTQAIFILISIAQACNTMNSCMLDASAVACMWLRRKRKTSSKLLVSSFSSIMLLKMCNNHLQWHTCFESLWESIFPHPPLLPLQLQWCASILYFMHVQRHAWNQISQVFRRTLKDVREITLCHIRRYAYLYENDLRRVFILFHTSHAGLNLHLFAHHARAKACFGLTLVLTNQNICVTCCHHPHLHYCHHHHCRLQTTIAMRSIYFHSMLRAVVNMTWIDGLSYSIIKSPNGNELSRSLKFLVWCAVTSVNKLWKCNMCTWSNLLTKLAHAWNTHLNHVYLSEVFVSAQVCPAIILTHT